MQVFGLVFFSLSALIYYFGQRAKKVIKFHVWSVNLLNEFTRRIIKDMANRKESGEDVESLKKEWEEKFNPKENYYTKIPNISKLIFIPFYKLDLAHYLTEEQIDLIYKHIDPNTVSIFDNEEN